MFVSLGLAGAISAAVVTERRRRRRRYVPGSGRRDDLLPIAPVVRSLHLAHLRTTESAPDGDIVDSDEPGGEEPGECELADGADSTKRSTRGHPGSDIDDAGAVLPVMTDAARGPGAAAVAHATGGLGATVAQALELAVTGGLGLVGPGARGVLRGLVLEFLVSCRLSPPVSCPAPLRVGMDGVDAVGGCDVVMPGATADRLVGRTGAAGWPARLHVTPDLGAALDQLEAITLHRARLHNERADIGAVEPEQSPGLVLLITEVPPDVGRLQAVLDNGAALGIGGALIGQWRPGASLYVAADGKVTSTSPGPGRHLHGRRLATLTAGPARDLLGVLTPDPDSAPSPARADPLDGHVVDAAHARARRAEMVDSNKPNGAAASRARGGALDAVPPIRETTSVASESAHDAGPAATESPLDHAPDLGTQGRVLLRVLGPVQLTWRTADHADAVAATGGQLTAPAAGTVETVSLGPRQRELLLVLSLHPDGIARDRLADTLWPDTPPGRPFNALHTTLNRLRRSLAAASGGALTDITRTDGDRYQLDPQVVVTDYQQLRAALAGRRAATDDEQRAQACRAIVTAYTGELGEGVSADWVETPREAVRRDVLDAAVTLARHAAAADPQEALDVLETSRTLDPYNEQLYRDIMRLQQRLGRVSSIGHTLSLLTSRLAEIDQAPEPPTIALAQRLAGPAPANGDPAIQPTANAAGPRRPATG